MKKLLSAFSAIKTKQFWLSILMDIVFVTILYIFSTLTAKLFESVGQYLNYFYMILLLIVYILICILIYSFFKRKVINIILGLKKGSNFFRFFCLNLVISAILSFLIFVSYILVNYFVRDDSNGIYQKTYLGVIIILLSLFFYIIGNLMQVQKVLEETRRTREIFRRNINKISIVVISEIFCFGVIYMIYILVYNNSRGSMDFGEFFQLLSLILLALFNSFNRIQFVNIVKE